MIKVGVGIIRELIPGQMNQPCLHPSYALVWKSVHGLPPNVPRDYPRISSEDYVFCEKCTALLAIDPCER